MRTFQIKSEYIDDWGDDPTMDIISEAKLETISRGWEVSPESLMHELTELITPSVRLYASYGTLGHEKTPVFTEGLPVSDSYRIIDVILPCKAWENNCGQTMVELAGETYLLYEVLTNIGNDPALRWYSNGHENIRKLREI